MQQGWDTYFDAIVRPNATKYQIHHRCSTSTTILITNICSILISHELIKCYCTNNSSSLLQSNMTKYNFHHIRTHQTRFWGRKWWFITIECVYIHSRFLAPTINLLQIHSRLENTWQLQIHQMFSWINVPLMSTNDKFASMVDS